MIVAVMEIISKERYFGHILKTFSLLSVTYIIFIYKTLYKFTIFMYIHILLLFAEKRYFNHLICRAWVDANVQTKYNKSRQLTNYLGMFLPFQYLLFISYSFVYYMF